MKILNMRALTLPLLLICCSVILSNCATLGLQGTPEEIVTKRAQAWVDALLDGNLAKAYKYTSPNYRQYATVGRYNARVEGTGNWQKAKVTKVECEEFACKVVIQVEYPAQGMKIQIKRPREYKWVAVDRQWWLFVPAR